MKPVTSHHVSLSALSRLDYGVGGWYEQEFPSLADTPASVELAERLDGALAQLPADVRGCVEAVVVAGLSYRDAAAEMGWWLRSGAPNGRRAWRTVHERGLPALRALLVDQPTCREDS